MVRYSFLVRLSHPLLHAGLSRRLLDHLIRPHQHVGRNCQSYLLGRLQVDYQLERCWLFNEKVGRLGTLENHIHVSSGAPVQVGKLTP
jgi:hypothetical protein